MKESDVFEVAEMLEYCLYCSSSFLGMSRLAQPERQVEELKNQRGVWTRLATTLELEDH